MSGEINNIRNGDTLRVFSPTIFQIFVITLTGKSIAVDVAHTDTFTDVKLILESKLTVPCVSQRLTYDGKQ